MVDPEKRGRETAVGRSETTSYVRAPMAEIYRRVDKRVLLIATCGRVFFYSGSLKSNGVFLDDMVELLDTSHSLVAWAFSLQSGLTMFLAPLVRMLILVAGHRKLCVIGGVLAGVGYIYTGIFATSAAHLFVGYGLSGIGFSMVYLPSYLALQRLYREQFPTATSFTGLFMFAGMAFLPPVVKYLEGIYGLRSAMILFGALLLNLIPCGVAVRLRSEKSSPPGDQSEQRNPSEDKVVEVIDDRPRSEDTIPPEDQTSQIFMKETRDSESKDEDIRNWHKGGGTKDEGIQNWVEDGGTKDNRLRSENNRQPENQAEQRALTWVIEVDTIEVDTIEERTLYVGKDRLTKDDALGFQDRSEQRTLNRDIYSDITEERTLYSDKGGLTKDNALRSEGSSPLEDHSEQRILNRDKDGYAKEEEIVATHNEEQCRPFVRKYFRFCSALFAHRDFAVVLAFAAANSFVLNSWVIFLVSFGSNIGLSEESAVFLSTAGGIGGFLGRVTCVAIFYFDRSGPYVACFPTVMCGLVLLLCTLAKNFFFISGVTLLFGYSLGLAIGLQYGSMPLTVCSYHFPQASALLAVTEGFMTQCSGIISGAIHDAFGSSVHVFAFNAAVCFVVAPLMFVWKDKGVKVCTPQNSTTRAIGGKSDKQIMDM